MSESTQNIKSFVRLELREVLTLVADETAEAILRQGDDRRSRLCGGTHASRSVDQESIGSATSRSSGKKAAENPLQKTPVQQSQTESRVASTLSGEPGSKRLDLDQAAARTVPYQGHQPGTRQIRSEPDGESRGQRAGVPTWHALWL